MSLASQVRVGGMGGFLGFDYSALLVILLAKQIPVAEWDFLIDRLNVIGKVAMKRWNEKSGE
jgi:hypothetical protein